MFGGAFILVMQTVLKAKGTARRTISVMNSLRNFQSAILVESRIIPVQID